MAPVPRNPTFQIREKNREKGGKRGKPPGVNWRKLGVGAGAGKEAVIILVLLLFSMQG